MAAAPSFRDTIVLVRGFRRSVVDCFRLLPIFEGLGHAEQFGKPTNA